MEKIRWKNTIPPIIRYNFIYSADFLTYFSLIREIKKNGLKITVHQVLSDGFEML